LSLEELLQLAVARVADGTLLGGNRVVSESGEVNADNIGRFSRLAVSVDHALTQIRTGSKDEPKKRLRELVQTVMPLLEMMEQEFRIDMHLAQLVERAQITSLEMHTTTTVAATTTEWRG
jgi:hypothetical protein